MVRYQNYGLLLGPGRKRALTYKAPIEAHNLDNPRDENHKVSCRHILWPLKFPSTGSCLFLSSFQGYRPCVSPSLPPSLPLCLCMNIYIYTYICLYQHTHTYTHVYTYVWAYCMPYWPLCPIKVLWVWTRIEGRRLQ